jgi:hypothetical protein
MRYGPLTTEECINLLIRDGVIYWTEDGYDDVTTADWLMIAIFFNTDEIHTFNQGMKTVIYLPSDDQHSNDLNKLNAEIDSMKPYLKNFSTWLSNLKR